MTLLATPALVLHAFDYRETSRIVRLVTRDAGVVSAVARGARRPKSKYGAALDLFASGQAQLRIHGSGDLHALDSFDATHARPRLAASLDRFAAASAIAEACMRFGRESEMGQLYDEAVGALDSIAVAGPDTVTPAGIAAMWRIISEIGFAPALTACASCHAPIPPDEDVTFHHRAGGALCASCARQARGGRRLPADARATIAGWLAGGHATPIDSRAAQSHLRLVREFLEEHLGDGRPLRALVSWEERVSGGGHRAGVAP